MRKIFSIWFILMAINCFSQFSKTHYIPPLTCQTSLVGDQYLYISTPSTKNVAIKIIGIGGQITNATVSNNNPYIYTIGIGDDTQLFTPKAATGKVTNKGYIIEADDLVYCSVRVNAGFNPNAGVYNHAGGIVSKGNSALGTTFRLGAMLNPLDNDASLLNFASILATENNTTVTISNLQNGTILVDGTVVNGPIVKNLNKNESYVIALENYQNIPSNSAKLIGTLVQSDKAIVVNSGSLGGNNSNQNGRDLGFDQIVPFEKTGNKYIFVKGIGPNELERVLLIAHNPNTIIYLNGNTTPYTTLTNPGDYIPIDGSQFSNGNLYITSSEKVFAYQSIGGLAPGFLPNGSPKNTAANQNMFFVPPLSCSTPNIVDNIPNIESIGGVTFNGGLNIVTEKNAVVSINNTPITATAVDITGNPDFIRYTINDLSGNIAVKSSKQVYVSYFGTNGAATYGGYYSGFDSKPEITSDKFNIGTSSCIPNLLLKVNTVLNYDVFEWFFNNFPIANSNSNSYTPTQPGFYQVKGSISNCGTNMLSDIIPVSNCPTDIDNDNVNDNIDLDNDNDGISNCTESYGNQNINISNLNSGNISIGSYSNSFTGTINTSTMTSGTPFSGNSDGSFISEIPAGKGNFVKYTLTFTKPISTGIEYVTTANSTDLLNPNAEYVVSTDVSKTITVLNPDNQLLIDTNYDGIYESGVTEYSSFEIRFQLNGVTPLAAGTGTFKFLTHLVNSISFTHKNLSDTDANRSTFKFFAVCVPKDSDSDGIADQLDSDSDNDNIPDLIESQVNNFVLNSTTDTNKNGFYDIFESKPIIDTDNDGIPDYLDLDSDNDGIYDSIETGSNSTDTDNDGIKNYRDLDSDNDLCNDVIEAGFTSANNNTLGNLFPPTVNINGVVTSRTNGYTTPNPNYSIAAPIIITNQPIVPPTCLNQNTSITISDNGGNSYQWQVSTNGTTWNNLTNNGNYSGVTSNKLNISSVNQTMNGYKYRVVLNKTGNSCGLISNETTLTILALPVVNNISIIQCDDDLDAKSTFNLTVKNNEISTNYQNEIFSYFTTLTAANTNDSTKKIANPLTYTANNGTVIWSRIENANNCFSVAKINLIVSATQIPATFNVPFENCDDYIDAAHDDYDGIAAFDFSSAKTAILALLPDPKNNYVIKYYETEADALAEINEITNTTTYRNTLYPNLQKIWVRVDSNLDNSCYGIGSHITLKVNPKPNIDINSNHLSDVYVCKNLPNFFVTLTAGILDGSPTTNYTYVWSKNNQALIGKTNATLDVNTAGTYSVKVTSASGCSRTRTITVTSSDIAHINNIEITELNDNNSVLILVDGQGSYEYSLDDSNNFYQDANLFENLAAGIHEVYIRDKNGCGITNETIAILGIPRFFTPNNDGFNDYWTIKGINSEFNTKTVIHIFDRFGKLIKDINPQSQGWDGTFNGLPLPADDYWYTAKLENGKEIKGHFSLKR
ncbi:T9SS type B sorting domain-containing protein [Flavobacterium sufflavum]|uniref:T9SS type B sorting domain-containing protein n=1 Tax=Flavobacterium sufflavum TaxID=1921138 RepID=A0A3S2U3U6_9FLAO|nr:T9SS type B sorting domain-containing protein [Flavobacterium sufflavum]RVT77394.1 T9SS type B sorting domain-containing protein [Flavobacterium sufflavum]